MLRFDSLEFIGFKSFAKKTRVAFDERITSIVGPNGCGKSNLADAIGWVLGVQTAHGLRGQKMDDLIFSGTEKRPPSGLARVSLKISRSADDPPFLFDGNELDEESVEVSRKLYRSGESEYRFNDRRCRRKDLHRFMDESGLGFAPYALIAQGRIDWFLSAKALERRFLIEEAAQISSYRSQRRSAEVKLESAQHNLLRVNDIILEVERQLRSLKRQAGKARRYREHKEEFDRLLRGKLAHEARRMSGQLEDLAQRKLKSAQAEARLASRLQEKEEQYRQSVQRRDAFDVRLSQLRIDRSDLRLEVERARGARRHHRETIETIGRQLDNLSAEETSLGKAANKIENDLERIGQESSDLENQESKLQGELLQRTESVQRSQSEIAETEQGLQAIRNRFLELSAVIATLENQREQTGQRLREHEAQRERTIVEKAGLETRLEELRDGRTRARKEADESLTDARGLREIIRGLDEKIEAQEAVLAAMRTELQDVQGRQIATRERLQSLREVELSRSQYSQGVQKLLNHLKQSDDLRTEGTLADRVETSPEFETLIETALGDELEYVIVDSIDDAVRGASEIKALGAGRCTFMSLHNNGFSDKEPDRSQLNGLREQDGVYGTLGELFDVSPDVRKAIERVLSERVQSVVVTDLARAMQLADGNPGRSFVTLEGEALRPSGLLSVAPPASKKLGLLSLRRQKRELEKKAQKIGKSRQALEGRVNRQEGELEALAEDRRRRRDELYQLEKRIIGLTHQVELCVTELERHEHLLEKLEQGLIDGDSAHQTLRDRQSRLEHEFEAKSKLKVELDKRQDDQQRNLDRLKSEFEIVRSQLHHTDSDRKVLQERRSLLDDTLSRLRERKQEIELQSERNKARQLESRDRTAQLETAIAELSLALEEGEKRQTEVESSLEKEEASNASWKNQHRDIEKTLNELRESTMSLHQEEARLDVEQARIETQLDHIRTQSLEQLGQELEEATEDIDPEEGSLPDIRARFQECRRQLENFGAVNMTALEDFQTNQERHEFLAGQREDIQKSIADTTTAIQDLNRRSRDKFKLAFDHINENFNLLFQKLFGGGECGMRLLDENDLLESGLDIFARPPGKKLQNIGLLSGGEKALTGLALLMALFRYRPSRFCLLDEVDAALDDANVARFAKLVQEMSEQTQFIIITHNKHTMEIADSMFGVTMEEPGVSQLVSVKF